ncbi:MAG: hydrogenase formation protein HypD [Lentisphaerae bacterium GWF2_52_8]|nr:MAG: hydrogenase formation protein HypD [Lentisphaerae bacterium GWF2_52_8]
MRYLDGFRNPDTAAALVSHISDLAAILAQRRESINIMEVCGSHTMAIARFALRELLPENLRLTSGPGCPVCVTDAGYIDAAIALAKEGHIIASFGDLLHVPGSGNTLAQCRSEGAAIEICASPTQALEIARQNPKRQIVFLAIGFETSIAPVTTLIPSASKENIENLSLLTAFKLVPPALKALSSDPEIKIDAFLCPAHVSAIIGAQAYEPFVNEHHIPCVIAGFEPLDILYGIEGILRQLVAEKAFVENQYSRVVRAEGNRVAQEIIAKYLQAADASWRGIGIIPESGLKIAAAYSKYDSTARFGIEIRVGHPNPACRCGDVLKGKIIPPECTLFAKACTPAHPVGPCMVSGEGSCSAYHKYSR